MIAHLHSPRVRLAVGVLTALVAVLVSVPARAAPARPATATDIETATATAHGQSGGSSCGRLRQRRALRLVPPGALRLAERGHHRPAPALLPGGRAPSPRSDPQSIIRVTRANATLSCQRISGCLRIEAPGVRIRDVAIRCTSGRRGEAANGTAVVDVRPGATAVVNRVTTNGMTGVHACVWHQGTRLRVRALDCRGVNDGVFSWSESDQRGQGDNFVIRDSYFHAFTAQTANGHVDGYQTEGAADGRITHNTWLITTDADNDATSAIAIWNGRRNSSDILVARNLIAGGGFSVYAQDYSPSDANPAGGYSVTDIRFVDNVFSRQLFGCVGRWGVWFPRGQPTDGWHRSGNRVLETGGDIDSRNPSYRGRACV